MKIMGSAILLAITTLVLSACGITGAPIPEDHYYRLPEVTMVEQQSTQFQGLHFKPVRVDGLYHERSLLYVETDTPLELRRYHYHYWVQPPALLIGQYIQAYFSSTAKAKQSHFSSFVETTDVSIQSQLLNFERLVSKAGIEVLVRLEFSLQQPGARGSDWTKRYDAQVSVSSASMHDTVQAYGTALQQIMQAFSADLAKLATAVP